jgi:predicted small lipoprotein YifL
MSATSARFARKVWPLLGLTACTLLGVAACGQRGPLYMPDRNARVVTRPAANTADSSAAAAASAPSSAPR